MSRRAKQILSAESRKAADTDSFVPVLLLSDVDVVNCSPATFLDILTNLNDLCASRPVDQRSAYVEQIYHRMLRLLSEKVEISSDHVINAVKQMLMYNSAMAILTLDDLAKIGIHMENRSVIIHFDMSASMNQAGFRSLVASIISLSTKLQMQGIQVHISLFGDSKQEKIHNDIGGRLLTLEEFIKGAFAPNGGGTEFSPSFERTKTFPTPHDAIIISDGEFSATITQLAFQQQCHTVFFVAPPWSPRGVEERHARAISSSVQTNVPYIGIASEKYSQLNTIIEDFLREHNFYVRLPGYVSIGTYSIPSFLLAPTQMIELFKKCFEQGEVQLQILTKRILGIFRYLEETATLNFERCLRGAEFQSLMSVVTPLIKLSQAYLETSNACQQLYGYLNKVMNNFGHEQQKLIKSLTNDPKAKAELTKIWDNAMSFNEQALIVDENEKKYGPPVAYLNVRIASLNCTSETLSEALQQLKTVYDPKEIDLLSLILDILSNAKLDDRPTIDQKESNILVWRKPDGIVDLKSILRQLPFCLRQYQHAHQMESDKPWTLQPLASIRLAWVMDASRRTFPDFIVQALPSLVVPNKYLTDLDQDENRTRFWLKVIREIGPKVALSADSVESINRILTVHCLKSVALKCIDGSVTYEKLVYENVLPFIDTDEPNAWCVFIDPQMNRVDYSTGKILESSQIITDPKEVERYYSANVHFRGAIVRPPYFSRLDFADFPEGAIELYNASKKKDPDILRDQLDKLGNNSYSTVQINAHIHTIHDRFQKIPCVLWGDEESIRQTVTAVKAACHGATIPTETITVHIPRLVVIDYLISECEDRFVAGALKSFNEYRKLNIQETLNGVKELDYALECGEKATKDSTPFLPTGSFNHYDKPVVQEYLKRQLKGLKRRLNSVLQPPQFQSLQVTLQQAQQTVNNDEVVSIADLETLSTAATTSKATDKAQRPRFDKILFTCPITLDIMNNPAATTPCGHMFEMDAINQYLITNQYCPVCRTAVTNVVLNYAFKSVIESWSVEQDE